MSASCENCVQLAEQNDALQKRAVDEFEKREAVVSRLAKADREIGGLKGELTRLRTDSPRMKDAEEVFRFWQTRLHKNARTTFGPERQKKVLARLGEKSSHADIDRKADLKWAVRGCEAMPFVGAQGRQASGGKRHDDLTLVCRDETTVERFMGYADDRADGMFRTFCNALLRSERADVSGEVGRPCHVTAQCPVCGVDMALVATPGTAASGDLLWIECRSGCLPDAVKDRLRGSAGLEVAA